MRAALGTWVSLLLACSMTGLGAAPTTASDDAELGPMRDAASPVVRPQTPGDTGLRAADQAVISGASTGNKNLDLLLDMQGKPGAEQRPGTPRSDVAAATAAAALTSLRARDVDRPATEDHAVKPAVRPFEGLVPVEGTGRATAAPPERREWIGPSAGSTSGGTVSGGGAREFDSGGAQKDNNRLIFALPREVIIFLRDQRYWLLGGLVVLAMLGAAIKSFSRRI
jgi:hypothetical protein